MIRLHAHICRIGKPDFIPEFPWNQLLVWDALTAISLSTDTIESQQSVRIIAEGVEHIQWALCEILPRDHPVPDQERNRPFYFKHGNKHANHGPLESSQQISILASHS